MLGRTGDTGLAYDDDVPNKHLHIEIHTDPDNWPPIPRSWDDYANPSILFGDDVLTIGTVVPFDPGEIFAVYY